MSCFKDPLWVPPSQKEPMFSSAKARGWNDNERGGWGWGAVGSCPDEGVHEGLRGRGCWSGSGVEVWNGQLGAMGSPVQLTRCFLLLPLAPPGRDSSPSSSRWAGSGDCCWPVSHGHRGICHFSAKAPIARAGPSGVLFLSGDRCAQDPARPSP